MVIKNIIKSETEPSTNCLWLKDNSLYHHNNGNWEPVDLNTVQGVERLEEDVSGIQTNIQKIERDYIGVWDELNNVKEILASIQSGELDPLLKRLNYTDDDINDFNEHRLRGNITLTRDQVEQSVYIWEHIDEFIYNSIKETGDISSDFFPLYAAPRFWDSQKDENGFVWEYKGSEEETTSRIITSEDFVKMVIKSQYIPDIVLHNFYSTTGPNNPFFYKINWKAAGNIDMVSSGISFTDLKSVTSANITMPTLFNKYGGRWASAFFGLKKLGNFTIGSSSCKSSADSFFRDSAFLKLTPNIYIDFQNIFYSVNMFATMDSMYNHRLTGSFDLSKVAKNFREYVNNSPGNILGNCMDRMFSNVHLNNCLIIVEDEGTSFSNPSGHSIDFTTAKTFENAVLDGNNTIAITYKTPPTLAVGTNHIIGNISGNITKGLDINNNINIFGVPAIIISNSKPVDVTLHLINSRYVTVDSNVRSARASIWIKDINDITTNLNINYLVADDFFTDKRFKECVDTWGVQTTPVNVVVTQSQYDKLEAITIASLTSIGFNLVIE